MEHALDNHYLQHQYENGLTLLGQNMEHVASAAVTALISAGASSDPVGGSGTAAVLSELIQRGAGERDSRQLSDFLNNLGLQRHIDAEREHIHVGGALLGAKLPQLLPAMFDVIRRPHLGSDDFESSRALALQGLDALEDEPRAKAMIHLNERFYPDPYGRPASGKREDLQNLTAKAARQHFERRFMPAGSIISVAGAFDWDQLKQQLADLTKDWHGQADTAPDPQHTLSGVHHLEQETAQVQIGVAFAAPALHEDDYYAARGAVAVLSGGMSGRLFTEVREKRGLVYAVSASYHQVKTLGGIICYAGTTTDKAQQTIDVLLAELDRLKEGVDQSELERAKTGLKSALVMQGESTTARAASAARDYYHLGRVRSLEQIKDAIDALDAKTVSSYLKRRPPGKYAIQTLGEKPLQVSVA